MNFDRAITTPDGMKQLWPNSMRWQTAVHLRTERWADTSVALWQVMTDNGIHYVLALVWPDVWHKANPSIVEGLLVEGRVTNHAIETRATQAMARVRAVLDDLARGRSPLRDVDVVIDTRDPHPPGRDN